MLFRPETCLEMDLANAASQLRTASVRQDQRQYCVLVTLPNHLFCNASLLQAVSRTLPRTHPVGSVVLKETREFAMSNIIIRPINPDDRAWVIQFITEHWGAEIVVSRGVVYHPQDLPGFVAIQEGKRSDWLRTISRGKVARL